MNESATEIAVEVPGWPPTKNEATSLLAARHSHAERVRVLLESVQRAIQHDNWTVVTDEVALDLVVRGPGRPPSDATNYLGGIGDVLQVKVGRNLDLTHLGELGAVALYADDRQIRTIHYSEEWATQPSYKVRIRRTAPVSAETASGAGT